MKHKTHWKWQIWFGVILLLLSVVLHAAHWLIFRDPHHMFMLLVGDIAFVPVEVLLVTLVLHQVIERREKGHMLSKLNMVIGAFFSEAGTDLLKRLKACEGENGLDRTKLMVDGHWNDARFDTVASDVALNNWTLTPTREDLQELCEFLSSRRGFLLGLLENPNLLEHEAFTDLLWAVFHLSEELSMRDDLADIEQADLDHLAGDVQRAYGQLVVQWLAYMKHLKHDYPFLFSLAVRTNPFKQRAEAAVCA